MTLPANIRVNLGVPFPAYVQGVGGISVTKVNGVWTIGPSSGTAISTGQPLTWTAPQTFNDGINANQLQITLNNTVETALTVSQIVQGSSPSGANLNLMTLADIGSDIGSSFANGLLVNFSIQGATNKGGRQAISGVASLTTITSAANTNRNYVGVNGVAIASANDNGTGVTVGTAAGAMFGGGFVGALSTGATNFLNVTGAEFNARVQTGASVAIKSCLQISADQLDRVQGSAIDAMLWASNQTGSNPGWNFGIFFDNGSGGGVWPIKSTGTIFGTGGGGTAALGIDLSNTTFSTGAFKSNGFLVDGNGNVSSVLSTNGTLSHIVSNQNTGASQLAQVSVQSNAGNLNMNAVGTGAGTFSQIQSTVNSTFFIDSKGATAAISLRTGSSPTAGLNITNAQAVQFAAAASFSANGAVATTLGSVGPTGSHTTVQSWLTILDNSGVTRYIPCF